MWIPMWLQKCSFFSKKKLLRKQRKYNSRWWDEWQHKELAFLYFFCWTSIDEHKSIMTLWLLLCTCNLDIEQCLSFHFSFSKKRLAFERQHLVWIYILFIEMKNSIISNKIKAIKTHVQKKKSLIDKRIYQPAVLVGLHLMCCYWDVFDEACGLFK